jgi:hypothetical protein
MREPDEPKKRAAQGEPHRAIGVSAKRGRHLSEQAFDTCHVFLYGIPSGTLGGASFQISDFRFQIGTPVARNQEEDINAARRALREHAEVAEWKQIEVFIRYLHLLCVLRVLCACLPAGRLNLFLFGRSGLSPTPQQRRGA